MSSNNAAPVAVSFVKRPPEATSGDATVQPVVRATTDFLRIQHLPRRTNYRDLSEAITRWLRVPGGTLELRQEQAWALLEACDVNGLVAALGVGTGKCVVGSTEIFDGIARRTVEEMVGKTFQVLTKSPDHRLRYAPATAFASGRKPCVTVGLRDGSTVTLSTDHPVFTSKGWVPAGNLSVNALVATAGDAPRLPLVAATMPHAGMVEAAMQSRCHGTRVPAMYWGLPDGNIAYFLNRLWFLSLSSEEEDTFQACFATSELADDVRFLLLRLGVHTSKHRRAATGAGTVVRVLPRSRAAFSASVGTGLGVQPDVLGPRPVLPPLAWRKVEYIEYAGVRDVYDLSVPDTGCFVGNGIVLHNTLISLLLPTVVNAQRPLLLVPASTRDKLLRVDIPLYRKHFRIALPPPDGNLRILSYEQLSQVKQAEVLKTLMPDLVIADEAHKLKSRGAACTKRLLRHAEEYPFMFVPMSGSVTKRSLLDYGHLARLALGDGSPLPSRFIELQEWAGALDELKGNQRPVAPGALGRFCGPDETVRQGFSRRLVETPGYIHTSDPRVYAADGAEVSLSIAELEIGSPPPEIEAAFDRMRDEWVTPDGDVIMSALDFHRHAHELVQGFFYRWVWPNGVRDDEWLETRKAWRVYVRGVIKSGSVGGEHYDTELQVARGVVAGKLVPPDNEYQKWQDVRARWRAQHGKLQPDTEPVWVSEYMVDAVEARWRGQGGAGVGGIVWVQHDAVLQKFAERGWTVYGPGEQGAGIITEDGTREVVASITAHGTGKNLQMFHRALYLAVPSTGTLWEQSLGRMHRAGQQADEVEAQVVLACAETWAAFDQARRDAAYITSTTQQHQRLGYADITVSTAKDVLYRAQDSALWGVRHG